MAAVKYEFSIGALKAFYSIFCPDILLVYISRNAVSEIIKNRPPKFHRSAPLSTQTNKSLVARTHEQVSLLKSCYDWLLNHALCQGRIRNFFAYTRANKTCQGKRARLYGA